MIGKDELFLQSFELLMVKFVKHFEEGSPGVLSADNMV